LILVLERSATLMVVVLVCSLAAEGQAAAGEPPVLPPIDGRPAWDGTFALSSGFDSNPNLLSEELSLPPAPGKEPVSGKDADTVSALDLRAAWHPVYRRDGWSTEVSGGVRRSFHQDLDFLDFGAAEAAVHLVRGSDPLGVLTGPLGTARAPLGASRFAALVQAGASYSELGGDPFLRTAEAAASLTVRPRRAEGAGPPLVLTATHFTLDVQDRAFFREHRPRSGDQVAAEVGEIVRFLHSGVQIRVALLAGDRGADEAFSESFLDAGTEVLLPLSRTWSLRVGGGWRRDIFDDRLSNLFNPVHGAPRRDETLRATALLTWEIAERLRGTARVTAARRNSNVDLGAGLPDLDYRRATAALGLSWVF
jgi:hypothetical protein